MDGTRILHYELGRLLGRGGMGEVYEARDTRLQRSVALKFISPARASDPDALQRFEIEAHAAAALSHPNIATVYALEREGNRLFISTELLPGGTLRDRVRRGNFARAEALALAHAVASALAHAHARGVVHRDIKPENLMFAADGTIKVTDFGLARLAHASHLTEAGTTIGTASYMAPEAIAGRGEARSDVFALGIVLYEMLAADLPFHADSPLAMLHQIVNAEPTPITTHRPELPADVAALVMSLLARDPRQRPDAATAAARLGALTGVATETPTDSDTVTLPVMPTGPARRRGLPRSVVRAVLAGVTGLVLVFVLVRSGVLGRGHGDAPDAKVLEARALADDAAHFLTLGQLDSAAARANAALALDPTNAGARINLAQVLRARGEATRAANLLAGVSRDAHVDPHLRAVAWEAIGDMAIGDGTWPEAVRAMTRSFALDSTERAYNQLGYALVRGAQPAEALALLRRGLVTYPGSAALHKNAGLALLQLDSLAAARLEAERAIALDPTFAPALGLRVRLAVRAANRAAAASAWNAYRRARPAPADSAEIAAELAPLGIH